MKTNIKTLMILGLFSNIAIAAELFNPNAAFYALNKKDDGHISISYHKPVDQYVKIDTAAANNNYYTLKIGESVEYVQVLEQSDRTLVNRTFKEIDPTSRASTLKTTSAEYDLSGKIKSMVTSENSLDNPEQEYTKVISPEICHELMVDDKVIEKMQECKTINSKMNVLTNKISRFVEENLKDTNSKLKNLANIQMPDEMSERTVLLEKSLSDCQFLIKNETLARVEAPQTKDVSTSKSHSK